MAVEQSLVCNWSAETQRIQRVLGGRKKKRISADGLSRAAVLIPIFDKDGECHILFTKRADTVEYHRGQISFPGGRRDEGDASLLDTALRESFEEIGLASAVVVPLGELDDEITATSNFIVSPFVASIPFPYEFAINAGEVESLLHVPVSALLSCGNPRQEVVVEDGRAVPAYSYHYDGQVIWGATARILKKFLELVFG